MAARAGNQKALELIHQYEGAFNSSATAAAASYNHYECLRWLVETQGCRFWEHAVDATPYTLVGWHAPQL
jgi:hypothetical protein